MVDGRLLEEQSSFTIFWPPYGGPGPPYAVPREMVLKYVCSVFTEIRENISVDIDSLTTASLHFGMYFVVHTFPCETHTPATVESTNFRTLNQLLSHR